MTLIGKRAIVTGAGRGLGRAVAVALAREGGKLVIASRTRSELEETAELVAQAGGEVVAQEADVGNMADVSLLVSTAMTRFGGVDILLNNAAIIGAMKPLHELEPAEWDDALAVDLRAPFLLAREVVPSMIRQKSGKIINVTSGLAEMVVSPFGIYSIAKAALNHLTRIMAAELKRHNIQVNGLDPGVMETRMQDEIRHAGPTVLGPEVFANFRALKERGHLQPPERIARLALFLASAESNGVTGEIGAEEHFKMFGYQPTM